MKIWVTGSQGLVGRALLQELCLRGINHVGTSRAEVDIAEEEQVRLQAQGFTHIINGAAYTAVDLAETDRESAYRSNVTGPRVLAKVARSLDIPFLHLSTDYVFDGLLRRPYKEEDVPRPLNYYGLTKQQGEVEVLDRHPDACIVRVSWVFGDRILRALYKERELRMVDDQISCPTYVGDLASALLALMQQRGIYHYCNREPVSKFAFAAAFWEKAKQKGLPIVCEKISPILSSDYGAAAERPLYTPLATDKVGALIPIRSWKEALDDAL